MTLKSSASAQNAIESHFNAELLLRAPVTGIRRSLVKLPKSSRARIHMVHVQFKYRVQSYSSFHHSEPIGTLRIGVEQ